MQLFSFITDKDMFGEMYRCDAALGVAAFCAAVVAAVVGGSSPRLSSWWTPEITWQSDCWASGLRPTTQSDQCYPNSSCVAARSSPARWKACCPTLLSARTMSGARVCKQDWNWMTDPAGAEGLGDDVTSAETCNGTSLACPQRTSPSSSRFRCSQRAFGRRSNKPKWRCLRS